MKPHAVVRRNAQNGLARIVRNLNFAVKRGFARHRGDREHVTPGVDRLFARGIDVRQMHADAITRDLVAFAKVKIIAGIGPGTP